LHSSGFIGAFLRLKTTLDFAPNVCYQYGVMKELTWHQRQVFEFIVNYQMSYGFPPSVREIAQRFGLKSNRTVRDYLQVLEKKGYLKVHAGKKRGIEILKPAGIAVYGRIGAGASIFADENIEDVLQINPRFFTSEPCFALRVKGDSMSGAGIFEGDYAIIKKQSHAETGQIVAALIEDEITLKRFVRKEDRIELIPENPAYKPIIFKDTQPTILGILVGLIRKV